MSLKRFFKVLLWGPLVFMSFRGYGQFDNKTPGLLPSSNSASVVKYANTPVNLYTGVPHISADLHTVQARGFSIPIALNYNASGIKVQEISGTVGLGWSLSVNSVITRVVRGLPDEQTNGYFTGAFGANMNVFSKVNLEKVIAGELDAEPDIFYVNLNGGSMKFVFDINKNPVYLNSNSLRILNSPFKKELGLDEWILEDLQGNKYFIGGDSQYTENSEVKQFIESGSIIRPSFVSTWFLKKIITSNEFETINYQYISGPSIKSRTYIQNKKYRKKTEYTFVTDSYIGPIRVRKGGSSMTVYYEESSQWNGDIETTISNPKYLSAITTSNENVVFSYNPFNVSRIDLVGGKFLESIEIKNFKDETLKLFKLNYFYQNSYNGGGLDVPEAQRLSLQNIQLLDRNKANARTLFAFTYNPTKLPLRNSVKTDHWGYYSNFGESFVSAEVPSATFKQADPALMAAGSLVKITYETGGFREFLFECNQYYNSSQKKEFNAGGLRIAAIKNHVRLYDPEPKTTTYTYRNVDGKKESSGKLIISHNSYISSIDHQYSQRKALSSGSGTFWISKGDAPKPIIVDKVYPAPPYVGGGTVPTGSPITGGVFGSSVSYDPYTVISSMSFNDRFDADGTIVGYSTVTETVNANNGYTVYRFKDIEEYPENYGEGWRVNSSMQELGGKVPIQNPPFTPSTSYSYARGLLKEQVIFNKDNIPVKRIINNYAEHTFGNKVTGLRAAIGQINTYGGIPSDTYYNLGKYDILPKILLLTSTEVKDYLPLAVSRKTDYIYDSTYPSLLKTEKFKNSNGDNIERHFKYVINKDEVTYTNSAETDAVNTLYTSRKFGLPLEQTTLVNTSPTVILQQEKTGYKNWTQGSKSFTLPETIYSGKGTNLKPRIKYEAYNDFGSVLQVSQVNSPKVSTKFGYNNLYPIASAQNAEPSEIFLEDFEELSGANIISSQMVFSGKKYYMGDYSVSFILPNNKAYKLSYYYQENGKWHYSGFKPYTGPTVITDGDYLDHIVIIPQDAQLSSSTFDPVNGATSSTDTKGLTTIYEYDTFQRLLHVRDQNGYILKKYEYNYAH